ncbi:DUF6777 domain-containing protein [Streptomyces sp. NPDC059861]|uniref:DUF6777 domain-containing protein n=1 Tax=Streptomyces sp. NPDC059861 TaxID=3346974 RepID=UPI0036473E32
MRIPTGTFVTACALSAALLAAGCGAGGDERTNAGDESTEASGELLLQPVADRGPDPFTASTATIPATPDLVTRTPQSVPVGRSGPGVPAPAGLADVRSYSGWTPGLYAGRAQAGSCDVDRQIRLLTADTGRADTFADIAGIPRGELPDYLRGLTSAELRADTRVTNHGYRAGGATAHQSVLQAGTAVLVDNRGVPRVRCACGNPLGAPIAMEGTPGSSGRAWEGYEPTEVIMVLPAPEAITNITLVDVVENTWIERQIGQDVRHDKVVPRPEPQPQRGETVLPGDGTVLAEGGAEAGPLSREPATGVVPPAAEGDAPLLPQEPGGAPELPGGALPQEPAGPQDLSEEIGPLTVPEIPDVPDGGGLIPDDPDVSDDLGDVGDVGGLGDLGGLGDMGEPADPDGLGDTGASGDRGTSADRGTTGDKGGSGDADAPESADSIFGSMTDVFSG